MNDRTRKFDRYERDEEFESFKDSDAAILREPAELIVHKVQISTTYYVPSHSNGFIHIYFPIHTPIYVPSTCLLLVPTWPNLRANQAAHTHPSNKERENPPDVIVPACKVASTSNFFYCSVRARSIFHNRKAAV